MIDPALRLQPGQQKLTPAQEAEAKRFAEEFIHQQLSTEPVDEPEAEAFLRQVYRVAGLDPPQRIDWLDGPLQLVEVLAPYHTVDSVEASVRASMGASVNDSVGDDVVASAWESMWESVEASVRASVGNSVWARVGNSVGVRVLASVGTSVGDRVRDCVRDCEADIVRDSVVASVGAYYDAPMLARYQFFDAYLAPNALHALAHFNTLVSGYWLGQDTAVLVRRPARLARDSQGRLHHATGKCLEYRDGWGLYAWHGVRVPKRFILAPETLTREEYFRERNVEVRRVIQERMGSRFVSELGGVVIDRGSRGTLYEVALPRDPERVAHYVQVQDASTPRQYFLRVPPTIRTAAEAVAWTFQVGVVDYHPAQET